MSKLLILSCGIVAILLTNKCESKERYYRPNLPEKLCTIGIIDIDGTTNYLSDFPEFLDNRYSTRYISFEKSVQKEYPNEVNDSLKEFLFTISSGSRELIKYQSGQIILNLKNYIIPDSIEFLAEEKYFLFAREKDSYEISAEVTVPNRPTDLKLISVRKEEIALSKPVVGYNIDTLKSAVVSLSFNNNTADKQYYALIMASRYYEEGIGAPRSGFLDFSVRESNSPGFFSEVHGLKVKRFPNVNAIGIRATPFPVLAYFIEGSKIPGDKCNITISTQFHGHYSSEHGAWNHDAEIFNILRIKLLSIPEELYLFEKSLNTYGRVNEDPFSEPVYLNGNIKGGNGIFAICRSRDLVINLSPPY